MPAHVFVDGEVLEKEFLNEIPRENVQGTIPIGAVIPFWGTSAPDASWLVCNGNTFNATTYAALNTLLGGNTLPDLKGKFLVGYDSADADYNAIGDVGGEKTHTLIEGELPAHVHQTFDSDVYYNRGGSGIGYHVEDIADGTDQWHPDTGSVGADNAHENRPPFYVINYIIKAL